MSINTNNYTFVSFGYYGQKPKGCDYPEILTTSKPQSAPQEPETSIEKWKRYAWTVLPLLTLINPVGSTVTVITEMAKTAKSVDTLVKHRSLYSAFQTALNIGTTAATVLEPLSPPLRTLFLGIQLLSLAHQTALLIYRYRLDVLNARYQTFLDGGAKRDKVAIYVINNLIAMGSMVFQNTFVVTFFFFWQTATAALHAYRQFFKGKYHFSKGKYLSGGVDIFIGTIRLCQGIKIFSQYLDKHFPQKIAHQPQEAAPICLIDPREKMKETLTVYETKLKNLRGEHFLYFKRNGPQEKFLILTSEADRNGALDPSKALSLIDQLSKRFDVKFCTITCVDDIQREIQAATQFGRVMGLMIRAHANPINMWLNNDSDIGIGLLDPHTISADTFAGLDSQCTIVLEGCHTASIPYDGLAYRVANLAKRVTYAADDFCCGISHVKLDPLEFSFEWPDRSVKTKKIDPFETVLNSLLRMGCF
ncbi:MAG TPA: hypothetical protein VFU89_05280 [Rhabdochlamydiaceae bacterium]|nr:hypothetical protein [Rhabdochlamydiaceae bacterium]